MIEGKLSSSKTKRQSPGRVQPALDTDSCGSEGNTVEVRKIEKKRWSRRTNAADGSLQALPMADLAL
jgi:hypothetical protein